MSPASTITSADPKLSISSFSLEKALGTLDLDLEQELKRYSQQYASHLPKIEGEANKLLAPNNSLQASSSPTSSLPLPAPSQHPAPTSDVEQALQLIHQSKTKKSSDSLKDFADRQIPPQDYLQSSEELLKTLAAEAAAPPPVVVPRIIWTRKTILLAALIATGGGLVLAAIFFPNAVALLGQLSRQAEETPQANTQQQELPSDIAENNTIPTTINLAEQEFVTLSLDNLSVISPSSLSSPSSQANANNPALAQSITPLTANNPAYSTLGAVSGGQNNLASALLPPSLLPQSVNPYAITPQQTPDGLKIGYYYIIFRSTNVQSLGKVNTLVPNAFIRRFPIGMAIQMAEISNPADAQAKIDKFRAANISAEIYHHKLSPVAGDL